MRDFSPRSEAITSTNFAHTVIYGEKRRLKWGLQAPAGTMDCILPNLYLGGLVDGAADPEALKRIEVSAVVCCISYVELPKRREVKGLDYFRVDVDDASHEPIKSYFAEAIEFIANKLHREERVLVHCRSGVSRSATIVVAFVVHHLKISVHDAFFLVRSKRPVIMPNLGFMDQLCEYEVEIDGNQGDPSIDTYKYTEWYTSSDPTGVPDLANEVDDGMFAAIPDAYPVIEGLSHRVSTLVARAVLNTLGVGVQRCGVSVCMITVYVFFCYL